MLKANRQGFVRELDVYSLEELEADESYFGFHRRFGLGWAAGTFINIPTGELAVFSVEREHDRGPMTEEDVYRLDSIRPHLARSALLSIGIEFQTLSTGVKILEVLSFPACAVSSNGQVVAANDLFHTVEELCFFSRDGKLRIYDNQLDTKLQESLEKSRAIDYGGSSIPARSKSGRADSEVHS
ncbi:MAG: hypothetical protein NTX04_01420 [Verrucomicrobia bacterium]|nr:hypothetical protein [Verrucomicrobiota bacterium]